METNYTPDNGFQENDSDLNNIISINSSEDIDDMLDFDLDYDVNEMYFALQGDN